MHQLQYYKSLSVIYNDVELWLRCGIIDLTDLEGVEAVP